MEKSLRPTRRKPGSLPDTRVKEAGDRTTCRDLGHRWDTRHPPRLDRDRVARPLELFTDNPLFARAQIPTSLRRNPLRSSPLHLHGGEFHLSKEISSDFESHQTLDRRAENHRSFSLERRHHRFAAARTIEPPPKPLSFKPSYLSAESILDLLRDLLRLQRAATFIPRKRTSASIRPRLSTSIPTTVDVVSLSELAPTGRGYNQSSGKASRDRTTERHGHKRADSNTRVSGDGTRAGRSPET
uniref:Uncharacterized protein n=1 Tax=Brassica campestris TaxID=3711 RepID=M4FAD8_BRACM